MIVQANRLPDGQRKIISITEVLDADGNVVGPGLLQRARAASKVSVSGAVDAASSCAVW